MGRPPKIKSPVGLDAALRVCMRKKRVEHRQEIFRAGRTVLIARLKREPTGEEIDAELRLYREPNFDAANCTPGFWEYLPEFVPVYEKQKRLKKAQCAASKRLSKENR